MGSVECLADHGNHLHATDRAGLADYLLDTPAHGILDVALRAAATWTAAVADACVKRGAAIAQRLAFAHHHARRLQASAACGW
ncbi:hypothetical protein D3C71_2099200 [compost metagenome]